MENSCTRLCHYRSAYMLAGRHFIPEIMFLKASLPQRFFFETVHLEYQLVLTCSVFVSQYLKRSFLHVNVFSSRSILYRLGSFPIQVFFVLSIISKVFYNFQDVLCTKCSSFTPRKWFFSLPFLRANLA